MLDSYIAERFHKQCCAILSAGSQPCKCSVCTDAVHMLWVQGRRWLIVTSQHYCDIFMTTIISNFLSAAPYIMWQLCRTSYFTQPSITETLLQCLLLLVLVSLAMQRKCSEVVSMRNHSVHSSDNYNTDSWSMLYRQVYALLLQEVLWA
jgi:hypothetical protein